MDKYTATEQAFKHGYEKGYKDAIDNNVGCKWIPVTESLPKPGKEVLCWYEYFRFGNYNRMFQTYGIGYHFRDGMWGGEVSNGQKAKVLAWMPLPEPPKEG